METPALSDDLCPVWLCELHWLGRVLRWSSEPVEIEDEDGTEIVYQVGLDFSYSERIELGGGVQAAPSVSLRSLWLPADIDAAERAAARQYPLGSEIELAIWYEGRTYEERIVRLVGEVTGYSYEPESISITAAPKGISERGLCPRSHERATAKRWPDVAESQRGNYYPNVIGKPGWEAAAAHSYTNGSPAIVVDTVGE